MTTTVPLRVFDLFYVPANGTYFASQDAWNAMSGRVTVGATVSMDGHDACVQDDGTTGEVGWWIVEDCDVDGESVEPLVLTLDLEPGDNTLTFIATFDDGQVLTDERSVIFDPSLQLHTGWIVKWDTEERTITFAVAPYEAAGEGGGDWGPDPKVAPYRVSDDAAFILLEPDSSGEPPDTVLDFAGASDLMEQAMDGECGTEGCFFAAWVFDASRPDEPRYPFALLITPDGELQQVEQIWGP